jgi:hypothetical protein
MAIFLKRTPEIYFGFDFKKFCVLFIFYFVVSLLKETLIFVLLNVAANENAQAGTALRL